MKHRRSVPPDVTKAVDVLLLYLINVVLDAANENAARDTGSEYYDAKTSPTGPTTFRRAAAAGAFASFKIGRKIVARKADVDAWIATQARTSKPKAQSGDDADGAFFASLQPRRPSR